MSSPTPEPVITYKPDLSLVLKAGAGAGKTTTLIRLFFEQVEHFRTLNQKWPRVVLTTFTRKATQEIRERLMKEALKKNDKALLDWLQSKYYVQISTIHGILSIFLSKYGDRLGLPNDFKLVDNSVILKSKKAVLRKIFNSHPSAVELLEDFSFIEILELTQKYTVSSSFHHIQRLTAVEIEAELKNEIISWHQQTQELRRLSLSETLSEKWQIFVEHFAMNQVATLNLADAVSILRNVKASAPSKPPHTSGKSKVTDSFNDLADSVKENLGNLIDKKLNFADRLEDYERVSLQVEEICRLFQKEWRLHQSTQGLITMEDLEVLSAEILKNESGCGHDFSKTFDYWMIDEYQDTSPLQVFLLNSLRGSQIHFVVGDPQQSIYLFRGARSEVFENKLTEVGDLGGEVHKQLINYRSRKEVLTMINHYFQSTSSQFEPMSVGSQVTDSETPALVVFPYDTKAHPPETVENQWTEKAAATRIIELLESGARPEHICVLSRNHKNLKLLSILATELKIPFYLHSSGNYFRQREVKDALMLLRFIDNPHDNLNFIALLRSPLFFKSDVEILSYCSGSSYWLEALNKEPKDEVLQKLDLILTERELIGDLAVFQKYLIESKMIDISYQLDPSGQREANLWKLIQLCEQEQARGLFQISDFCMKAEKIDSDSSGEDRESAAVVEPSRVQLMTIHASKGLQFPHIILLGFGDESKTPSIDLWNFSEEQKKWTLSLRDLETGSRLAPPLAYSIIETLKAREADEAERLLYVAMTRAESSVTLTWSQIRKRSWAAKFPWDLSEGLQNKTDFSYSVRKELRFSELVQEDKVSQTQIKTPWAKEKRQTLTSISVTELLEKSTPNSVKKSSRFVLPDLEKSKKGQSAHRIFEALKYNSEAAFRKGLDPEMQKAVDFTLRLKTPPLKDLLPEAFAEWGFTIPWKNSKLVGQIDLWALHDGKLWVIDYKTGNPNSSDKSLKQLQIYAECLFRTKRADDSIPIYLCAIYPMDEKVFLQEFKNRKALLQALDDLIK